jgi:SAM-dependent methyltransferase
MGNGDRSFAGSIPQLYEDYLVPLIFEPYASDMANRVASVAPERVLEIAAGTGVATRHMARTLPDGATIVATDLNQSMLDMAASRGAARAVEWRQADAMQLPFADAAFDAVVCEFGAMFFPDRAAAFHEAHRVLRPGGAFLLSVWDRIEDNEFADVVTQSLAPLFPGDPPRFLARLPHGYHDLASVTSDLGRGGFARRVEAVTLTMRSRAASPRLPAVAYCEGTPLRNEIEARDGPTLADATDAATAALAARFGSGAVDGKIQAHVLVAVK